MYKFLEKYYSKSFEWYKNFHLNLGIKKFISNEVTPIFAELGQFVDNNILLPIYDLLRFYFTLRIGHHYGASYRNANYKSHNLDYGSSNLGYGLLHQALIRNLRPKKVLCIGSMYGFIPFMCAEACRLNGFGTVDFVDAGYDEHNPDDTKRHSFGLGFWKKNNPSKHFSFLNTDENIQTYVMTTLEYSKKFPKRTYDYIYIDGDHTYEGVKLDYKLFWKRLNKGGYMVFHDTDTVGMYGNLYFDVDRFLKETVYAKNNYFHFPNSDSGLVITQKT